jgi:hypothetical protein
LNDKVRRSKQHTCVEKTAFDTFGKELASKFEPVEWHPNPSHTPAYKSLSQVLLRRGYRAFDLMWSSGVVLHDSWW